VGGRRELLAIVARIGGRESSRGAAGGSETRISNQQSKVPRECEPLQAAKRDGAGAAALQRLRPNKAQFSNVTMHNPAAAQDVSEAAAPYF
jgi:hypothetical protein